MKASIRTPAGHVLLDSLADWGGGIMIGAALTGEDVVRMALVGSFGFLVALFGFAYRLDPWLKPKEPNPPPPSEQKQPPSVREPSATV